MLGKIIVLKKYQSIENQKRSMPKAITKPDKKREDLEFQLQNYTKWARHRAYILQKWLTDMNRQPSVESSLNTDYQKVERAKENLYDTLKKMDKDLYQMARTFPTFQNQFEEVESEAVAHSLVGVAKFLNLTITLVNADRKTHRNFAKSFQQVADELKFADESLTFRIENQWG